MYVYQALMFELLGSTQQRHRRHLDDRSDRRSDVRSERD